MEKECGWDVGWGSGCKAVAREGGEVSIVHSYIKLSGDGTNHEKRRRHNGRQVIHLNYVATSECIVLYVRVLLLCPRYVHVLLLCPRDIYHVSSGCMTNIALSPWGATHPLASVQYLPYILHPRDITNTNCLTD